MLNFETDKWKANRDRKKAEFFTLVLPSKSKRRSLVDEKELKVVKRRLKKAKATPKKVAKAINVDPSLDFTTSRSTIIRRMNLGKRKREESKQILF